MAPAAVYVLEPRPTKVEYDVEVEDDDEDELPNGTLRVVRPQHRRHAADFEGAFGSLIDCVYALS